MTAPACIVHFACTRMLVKMPEHIHQVPTVNVVAHLLAFVTENRILLSRHRAFHEVRKKSVQLCPGMFWARQTASAENSRLHSKIFSVLLHQQVCCSFRCPKERMLGVINAHVLINAVFEIRML